MIIIIKGDFYVLCTKFTHVHEGNWIYGHLQIAMACLNALTFFTAYAYYA